MNERYFEKLKRQVKRMDEDQLKGYLEQGLLFVRIHCMGKSKQSSSGRT